MSARSALNCYFVFEFISISTFEIEETKWLAICLCENCFLVDHNVIFIFFFFINRSNCRDEHSRWDCVCQLTIVNAFSWFKTEIKKIKSLKELERVRNTQTNFHCFVKVFFESKQLLRDLQLNKNNFVNKMKSEFSNSFEFQILIYRASIFFNVYTFLR